MSWARSIKLAQCSRSVLGLGHGVMTQCWAPFLLCLVCKEEAGRKWTGEGAKKAGVCPGPGGFSRPTPASTGVGWVSSPCLSSLGAQTHRHSLGKESGPSSAQRRLYFTRRPSQNWVLLSHLAQGGHSLLRTLIFTNHWMGDGAGRVNLWGPDWLSPNIAQPLQGPARWLSRRSPPSVPPKVICTEPCLECRGHPVVLRAQPSPWPLPPPGWAGVQGDLQLHRGHSRTSTSILQQEPSLPCFFLEQFLCRSEMGVGGERGGCVLQNGGFQVLFFWLK